MNISKRFVLVPLLAWLIQPLFVSAVTVGQIDTFEDGTTDNWLINLLGMGGSSVSPVNMPSGGPGGVDDNYLQLTATGSPGAGGRLTVINVSQWMGDYLAAGIKAIEMDVNNFGSTDVSLRLLFAFGSGGPPTDVAISTAAIILPAGGGWTSIHFPIMPSDLTALTGSVTDALTNATELRLFHSPDIAFPGPAVVASLGVDNIAASPVPLPAAGWLFGSGLIGLLRFAKRRIAVRP